MYAVPQPADDPRPGDVIVISQTTVYYFVIAVLFFIAGFAVAHVLGESITRPLGESDKA